MTQTSTFPIVGAHFRPPAKAILQALHLGAELKLRPEPTNAYDPNAIQVLVSTSTIRKEAYDLLDSMARGMGFTCIGDGDEADVLTHDEWHLGYIPRTGAAELKLPGEVQGTLCFDATGKPQVKADIP